MRKRLRCQAEMVENLDVKVEGGAYGIKVTEHGIFKRTLGKIKCAVCTECGYVETYVENVRKIQNLTKED